MPHASDSINLNPPHLDIVCLHMEWQSTRELHTASVIKGQAERKASSALREDAVGGRMPISAWGISTRTRGNPMQRGTELLSAFQVFDEISLLLAHVAVNPTKGELAQEAWHTTNKR